jgi:hypothetical protein
MGKRRNACKSLPGKPQGKRLIGRFRHSHKNRNKTDLKETGFRGMNWIG